jgi:hypothetical protein
MGTSMFSRRTHRCIGAGCAICAALAAGEVAIERHSHIAPSPIEIANTPVTPPDDEPGSRGATWTAMRQVTYVSTSLSFGTTFGPFLDTPLRAQPRKAAALLPADDEGWLAATAPQPGKAG